MAQGRHKGGFSRNMLRLLLMPVFPKYTVPVSSPIFEKAGWKLFLKSLHLISNLWQVLKYRQIFFSFFPFVKCNSIDMNSRQTVGRTILVVFKIREIFFKSNNFRWKFKGISHDLNVEKLGAGPRLEYWTLSNCKLTWKWPSKWLQGTDDSESRAKKKVHR